MYISRLTNTHQPIEDQLGAPEADRLNTALVLRHCEMRECVQLLHDFRCPPTLKVMPLML
jgi:hypothetical protein